MVVSPQALLMCPGNGPSWHSKQQQEEGDVEFWSLQCIPLGASSSSSEAAPEMVFRTYPTHHQHCVSTWRSNEHHEMVNFG